MPLYLVRWPNLSAALVRAANEEQLIDILDEIANPDGCTWTVYQGPLFLDFELGARIKVTDSNAGDGEDDVTHLPLDPARIRIEGAQKMATRDEPSMTVRIAGETGWDMERSIAEFAFPATASVFWSDEYDIDPDALEQALKDDAMRLVEYTWRRSQLHRSEDPDAQLALMMDASLRWVKQTGQRTLDDARGEHGLDDDDDDLDESVEADVANLLELAHLDWLDAHDPDQLRESLVALLEVIDGWHSSE